MGDNIPRRHHYIPVMLLKNFCDSNGFLWVGHNGKIFRKKPENVFVQRDLNATFDLSDVPSGQDYEEVLTSRKKGYEHEAVLSEIEDRAAPAVRQIINQARRGKCPQLTPALRAAWKQFVVASLRRTPESQERESSAKKISDSLYEDARNLAARDDLTLPVKAGASLRPATMLHNRRYGCAEYVCIPYPGRVARSLTNNCHAVRLLAPGRGCSWLLCLAYQIA